MVLPFISAGLGIAQAGFGFANASAQTAARNKALMEQYKYQLKIRKQKNEDQNADFAQRVIQYRRGMSAADKAASRAYGTSMYNQSQRLKAASASAMQLNRALARSGGAAAAAGKSGRSAARLDTNIENQFVRNQATIAANLLAGEEAESMRNISIQNQLESRRNQLYSNVAIAPRPPMEPMRPTMASGPNPMGAILGAASSVVGAFGQFQNMQAPDPGTMGGTPFPTQTSYQAPSLMTSGINFFG